MYDYNNRMLYNIVINHLHIVDYDVHFQFSYLTTPH